MRSNIFWAAGAAALALTTATARAVVPVVDGTADAGYGAAIKVQNTLTGFGDNLNPDPIASNSGSEIDQVFARVDGPVGNKRLYVMIAGNLEPNFNKMEVFIDSVANSGFNTIAGGSLPTQVDGYCCTQAAPVNLPDPASGALQRTNGLTFDTGFGADYYLTFSHGREETGPAGDREGFWAITAHYASLNAPQSGQALGMQLAPKGLPNVLRGPLGGDFDSDFDVDGVNFLKWQQNVGAFDGVTTLANKADGDANGDRKVDAADLAEWASRYASDRLLTDHAFNPFVGGPSSNALVGPALPGLSQGQLIDKNYVAAHPGLGARELPFATAVDGSDPNNALNHRDMSNTVNLEMGFNNSNIEGVSGGGSPFALLPGDDPQNVMTGLEFSIPLSQIGAPTGEIKLTIFVNNNGHKYASNQFAGDGILDINPGGNGFGGDALTGDMAGVNMLDYAGDQFVIVTQGGGAAGVPEPAAATLAALALVGCGLRRRRR